MVSLLNFVEVTSILPFFFMPVIFIVVFAIIIVVVAKRVKAEKRQQETNVKKSQITDGNGRTQQQRDYINTLRVRQSERKISSADGEHSHSGTEERYAPIVGSLGEVNDEGCEELDGVRLLEHDEAYCDDPEHMKTINYDELQRIIVIGEVVNNPRFNNPYIKKKM